MKPIGYVIKDRVVIIFSLLMVIVLVAGAGTANGATVSGASIPPMPAGGVNSGVQIQLQSFQSGDWVYDKNNPEDSPAWKEFSSKLRHDTVGVNPGDYERVFREKLTPAGLNMDVCKQSSIIWMTRDISRPGSYTMNAHSNWMQGYIINGQPAQIAASLRGAPVIGGTARSTNLNAIAEEVANHSTIKNMPMHEMKVICSAQFAKPVKQEATEPVEECVGSECDEGESPEEVPAVKDSVCYGNTEGKWYGGSSPQGSGASDLGAALAKYDALSGIQFGVQGAAQLADADFVTRFRWKCETRYMSHYQVAPTSYHTRTTLANVKNDETGQVGNVFELIQKRTGQNFKSNSNLANVWYDGMKIASTVNDLGEIGSYLGEALGKESGLTKTGFADKWNELNSKQYINSRGEFEEFYKMNRGIDNVVNSDKKNKNFSSGTSLPATQQALLATGGVLNVEERERNKVVRTVQPYVDIQIDKCSMDVPWIVQAQAEAAYGLALIGSGGSVEAARVAKGTVVLGWAAITDCNNFPPKSSTDYSKEKPNTETTNANEIMIDQANHILNRSANILSDGTENPMTAVSGLMQTANAAQGNLGTELSWCAESAATRMALLLPGFDGFTGGFGGIADMIGKITQFMGGINNLTLDCTYIAEMFNPPYVSKLAEIALNMANIGVFVESRGRGTTHVSFVPSNANVIVQKAQYDPETVSWWQVLSVNCNLPGFEMALAGVPGSDILSDQIDTPDETISSSVGRNIHAVAKSPTVQVDVRDRNTRFTPQNYMFARPGTPSSQLSFYDKECGFSCINDNDGFGASSNNDATGNTPSGLKYEINANDVSNKFGAQMKDQNNADTYKSSERLSELDSINTNFFNVFRDNEERRIRVDTWYPTNPLGTVSSYIDELRNIASNSTEPTEALSGLVIYANNLIDNISGEGGSIGLLYDGSAPISTTVTRYQEGTPAIEEFFNIYAVKNTGDAKGTPYGEQSLDASKGEQGEQLFLDDSAGIPRQRAHSQDLGTGNKTVEIIDGFVNTFDVKSMWASEKSKPQVFNFKWEYQTASLFPSINAAGFNRTDGTEDKGVTSTNGIGLTMTFLEGKCYAMFGTELGKRTADIFQANTGTGSVNHLDNNETGLASQSPVMGDSNEENMYVNSLRSSGE